MRSILEFLESPVKKGNSQYGAPCPWCGTGEDRLVVRIHEIRKYGIGTFWCRICKQSGDVVSYVQKIFNVNFKSALEVLGSDTLSRKLVYPRFDRFDSDNRVNGSELNDRLWSERVTQVVKCTAFLRGHHARTMSFLSSRGITEETANHFNLCWLAEDLFLPREECGLSGSGRLKIPSGLLIPTWLNNTVVKLAVRCRDVGKTTRGRSITMPKYWQVAGSQRVCLVLGDLGKPTILVESELDAYLIWQEARQKIAVIATSGISGKLCEMARRYVDQAPILFISFDFDVVKTPESFGAGQNATVNLRNIYSQARILPPAIGKDPTEMHLGGYSISEWVDFGLRNHSKM
jgi:hypothetical protein